MKKKTIKASEAETGKLYLHVSYARGNRLPNKGDILLCLAPENEKRVSTFVSKHGILYLGAFWRLEVIEEIHACNH